MSLRSRIALLVGLTVLLASVIGGIGTSLSSLNVGRDRVDQALLDDVALIPANNDRLGAQLQFAFEARRQACEGSVEADGAPAESEAGPAGSRGPGRRLRAMPEFASTMQWLRPNGTALAACQTLPINGTEQAIAVAGSGSHFRTVTIDGERFRVHTQGFGRIGAVQFARSLEITQDTLRSLLMRSVLFGAIGAALAAGIGWLFASRVTEPVKRLSATVERVSTTQDLGERIVVDGDDEISALAASFNAMLETLQTSRGQQHQLVQDASHELRTPLTSIRTNVELLQRHTNIDPAVREQVLADIGIELTELSSLTAELVDSATEIPNTMTHLAEIDLAEVVTECVERARRRHRRSVEITVDTQQSSVVAGDVSLLARCVTNLLDNAVKYSESDAPIEAAVSATTVVIRDRGPGISTDDLPRIFDRFYRATEARSAPGSGLGLAIVKQIVEAHGGSVRAANRPDGGAEIGFELPGVEAESGTD